MNENPTQGTPAGGPVSALVLLDAGVAVMLSALAAVERDESGRAVLVLHSGRRIVCPSARWEDALDQLRDAAERTKTIPQVFTPQERLVLVQALNSHSVWLASEASNDDRDPNHRRMMQDTRAVLGGAIAKLGLTI